ncbi:MAG: hypothetical protein ACYC35_23080 [Pirellulales bacterium]
MTEPAAYLRTLLVALVVCSAGCIKAPSNRESPPTSASRPTTYDVALVGDETRVDLLRALATANHSATKASGNRIVAYVRRGNTQFRLFSTADDDPAAQAALAWEADLALLATDSADGPMPVHREQIIVSRQMAVPNLVIALTRSQLIDDGELLELEELEMRELLKAYGFAGDNAVCVFDHPDAKAQRSGNVARGPEQIAQVLETVAKKRSPLRSIRESKRFPAGVYCLAPQEVFARDVAGPVKNGSVTMLVGGKVLDAEVTVTQEVPPGSNGLIEILVADPLRVGEGQRFLLLRKDHVTAVGFFR